MTTSLAREVREIQNPAFGAVLLWRFAYSYGRSRKAPEAVPLSILFVPLPVLFREESRQLIAATRPSSGLRAFANKFRDSRAPQADILFGLGAAIRAYQPLTLISLRLAFAHRLLYLDPSAGEVFPLSGTRPTAGMPAGLREEWLLAERLGGWCGAVTPFELASTLRVAL